MVDMAVSTLKSTVTGAQPAAAMAGECRWHLSVSSKKSQQKWESCNPNPLHHNQKGCDHHTADYAIGNRKVMWTTINFQSSNCIPLGQSNRVCLWVLKIVWTSDRRQEKTSLTRTRTYQNEHKSFIVVVNSIQMVFNCNSSYLPFHTNLVGRSESLHVKSITTSNCLSKSPNLTQKTCSCHFHT